MQDITLQEVLSKHFIGDCKIQIKIVNSNEPSKCVYKGNVSELLNNDLNMPENSTFLNSHTFTITNECLTVFEFEGKSVLETCVIIYVYIPKTKRIDK